MRKDIFTIPNMLSYLRIALIPVFVVLFCNAYSHNGVGYHIAAVAVLLFSGLTDMLDGKIARKFNQITELGKIVDPLADYLTQFAVVVCLAIEYWPLIPVIALLVIKEISMAVLGVVFLRKGKKLSGAQWYGKVTTVVFYAVMVVLLAVPHTIMSFECSTILIIISGTWMLFSFIMYVHQYALMWRELKAERANKPQ